jgi:hypothetical protein
MFSSKPSQVYKMSTSANCPSDAMDVIEDIHLLFSESPFSNHSELELIPPSEPSGSPVPSSFIPTNPTIQPTNPTIQPTNPTIQQANPTIQQANPTIQPTNPTIQQANPTNQANRQVDNNIYNIVSPVFGQVDMDKTDLVMLTFAERQTDAIDLLLNNSELILNKYLTAQDFQNDIKRILDILILGFSEENQRVWKAGKKFVGRRALFRHEKQIQKQYNAIGQKLRIIFKVFSFI